MINKRIFLILILFLISLKFILAQNITVDYLNEVQLEKEFSFKIKLIDFDSDTYDVKIDLLSGGERVANILNGGIWKSTYYYVNDIMQENQEKEFLLRVIKEFEEARITIKIKNSKDTTETFEGYTINFDVDSVKSTENNTPITQNDEDEENSNIEEDEENDSAEEEVYIIQGIMNESQEKTGDAVLETINLNTEKNTKELDISKYLIYGLGVFVVLVSVLILIRRKKYQNEFK